MKVHKEMFDRWNKYITLYLKEYNMHPDDIKNIGTAWSIAFKLDIPKEAYHCDLHDAHIDTALKKIFKNITK